MSHNFILQPGEWIGEGKISFSSSPERLHYYTKWVVQAEKDSVLNCQQKVEVQGSDNQLVNDFRVSALTNAGFRVELKNEHVDNVSGQGVIDGKTIAWEFRGTNQIEGFEVYELQENGDYTVHAEYASMDHFRTIIDGRIWKKSI